LSQSHVSVTRRCGASVSMVNKPINRGIRELA
jgi:hypothetical protein